MDLADVWFWLICFLWTGYFVLEGFDFGVGMLLPVLGRDQEDSKALFDSIGPVWDGNEVWLLVAGGATFAAFPLWYATMFSGLYLALVLVLVLLIVRVISFEWHSKTELPRWRAFWTWMNTLGSVGAPLVWGIAFANLLQGLPINDKGDYTGNFADLFSLYSVFVGIAFVALFAFHGSVFLTLRTQGDLLERVRATARTLGPPALVLVAAALAWTVAVAIDNNDKGAFPSAAVAAVAGVVLLAALLAGRSRHDILAFVLTAGAIAFGVVTIFISLYPRVMVSSTDFANSLTVDNAASADYTLKVMTIAAAVMVPIVVLYQSWSYHIFRARVGGGDLESTPVDLIARRTATGPADAD